MCKVPDLQEKSMSVTSPTDGSCLDEILDQSGGYPQLIINSTMVHRKHIIEVMKYVSRIDKDANLSKEQRQQVEVLSDLMVRYLHIITKLNFHREHLSMRNSIFYKARHPWKCFQDSVDLYFFQKNCTHFLSLQGEIQQFERANNIH